MIKSPIPAIKLNKKSRSLSLAILYWVSFVFLLFLSSSFVGSFIPKIWERFAYGILGTISALIATWFFLRIGKKSFKEIGLVWERQTFWRFIVGILIGTGIFILIILLLLGFTELQLVKNPERFDPLMAFGYLAIFPLAFMEEIAFRSYPFIKLNKAFRLRFTQIIAALAFALYHIIGGWDPKIAFLGPGIWAFVFGLSAIWSRGIAMPTGIHVALNVIQPLIGISGGYASIWTLKHKTGVSENEISKTAVVEIGVQLFILILAILMTEFYIRKIEKK